MVIPQLSDTSASPAEVNALTWTAAKSFLGYGVRFALRTNHADGLAQVLPYLPLGWHETPPHEAEIQYSLYSSSPAAHLLYANTELIARADTSAPVLRKFGEHSRLQTALYAKAHLFVHAGVVGWHGHAILIPGRSLSGKSTLVRALVRAGATYYSDEFAVLDRDGFTHPYPLPLSLRAADGTLTHESVASLGGRVGTEPLPVKLITLTHYQPAAVWDPRPLPPSQALLALMDNTVAARREPHFSMPILRATVLRATTLSSPRADAESIVPMLLEQVAQA